MLTFLVVYLNFILGNLRFVTLSNDNIFMRICATVEMAAEVNKYIPFTLVFCAPLMMRINYSKSDDHVVRGRKVVNAAARGKGGKNMNFP
jgi:hypothetical protein